MLHCPKCKSKETFRKKITEGQLVIIFKCMFSSTFDLGLSDEEMQKKLDEFESSGEFDKWLEKPLI